MIKYICRSRWRSDCTHKKKCHIEEVDLKTRIIIIKMWAYCSCNAECIRRGRADDFGTWSFFLLSFFAAAAVVLVVFIVLFSMALDVKLRENDVERTTARIALTSQSKFWHSFSYMLCTHYTQLSSTSFLRLPIRIRFGKSFVAYKRI